MHAIVAIIAALSLGAETSPVTGWTGADPSGACRVPTNGTRIVMTATGTVFSCVAGAWVKQASGMQQVAAPTITPNGGAYVDPMTVTLATTTSGAAIYYTTDGSTPTASSTLYSIPFTLTRSGTVRAIAIRSGYLDSAVTSATFSVSTSQVFNASFSTPGCIASGTVIDSIGGTTLTVSRSSAAYYRDASGTWQPCPAGQARVGYQSVGSGVIGLMVEPAGSQLYPTPTAPASGTATATVTGAHVFWVEGSGSQTISAGTATTTGLPCTATAWVPCRFTVSVVGTLTLGTVSGTLARAQLEAANSPTSFMPTAGANVRTADSLSWTTPTSLPAATYCMYAKASNVEPWNASLNNTAQVPLTIGTYNSNNSSTLWIQTDGNEYASVKDASTLTTASFSAPSVGWIYGGHDFAICNDSGGIRFYVDGALRSTGAVRQPVTHATSSYVGTMSGGASALYIREIIFQSTSTFIDRGRAVPQVAMLGDSITAGTGGPGYPDTIGKYVVGRYMFVNHGVSGDTVSQMQTRYTANIKGKGYSVLTIMGGVNDLRVGTSAATVWTTYKAIVDDALASGMKVVALTVLPWKPYATTWTTAAQTETNTLNSTIKAYVPTTNPGNYYTVDTFAVLTDGSDQLSTTACGGATCDYGDHLHLTTAGETLVATTIWQSAAGQAILQ